MDVTISIVVNAVTSEIKGFTSVDGALSFVRSHSLWSLKPELFVVDNDRGYAIRMEVKDEQFI